MGYTISFYSLDWTALAGTLRAGRPGLAAAILRTQDPGLLRSALSRGQDVAAALQDLLGGPLGQRLAERTPAGPAVEDLTPAAARALVLAIEHLGLPAGELHHNSRAGERFRDEFLDVRLPLLIAPFDWYQLVDRPLFGVTFPGYPSWGGLSAAECAQLFAPPAAPGPAPADDDEEDWLTAVAEAGALARTRGTDLTAIYD